MKILKLIAIDLLYASGSEFPQFIISLFASTPLALTKSCVYYRSNIIRSV